MSNNTQSNIIIGGALAGGLLFFGFLSNTCTSSFSKSSNKTTEHSENITSSKLSSNQPNLTKLKSDYLKLADQNKIQLVKLHALDLKLKTLQKKLSSVQQPQPGNSQAMELKLHDLTKNNEALKSNIARLKSELEEQRKKFQSAMKGNTDQESAKIAELKNSLKSLDRERQSLADKLTTQHKNHLEEIKKLKTMSSNAGVSDNKLQLEVNDLTSELELNKAKTRNFQKQSKALQDLAADQKTQITKLSAQVNKFKAQKNMFVESVDDLPQKAKALFTALKALEGKSAADVKTAYPQITLQTNSTAKARIKFSSGKSNLSAADQSKIAELINAADDNAYFLIVGYADKSGNAAGNQRLSSKRSTNVAKAFAAKAKGFQAAQAVYLGQTDRFGSSDENRVVEIWQIK